MPHLFLCHSGPVEEQGRISLRLFSRKTNLFPLYEVPEQWFDMLSMTLIKMHCILSFSKNEAGA